MSACISRHGEFGEHTLDDSHTCTRCHVLDEEALCAELESLRAALAAVEQDRARLRERLDGDAWERLAERMRQPATSTDDEPGPVPANPFAHCHKFVGVGWCHRSKGHAGNCSTSSKDDEPDQLDQAITAHRPVNRKDTT